MTRDFFADLAEYTGRDRDLVVHRCGYASIELAFLFPQYKGRILDYYRETDLYIYALSGYQQMLSEKNFQTWLAESIRYYGWKTMLDYGGGIGEATIVACHNGVETDYQDVENSKTWDYAKWRFQKHGVNPKMLKEGTPIKKEYDVIVAMDVLEHLENPNEVIKEMADSTNRLICNPDLILYNEKYPEHISKVDISPYFEQVYNYLYRRKSA